MQIGIEGLTRNSWGLVLILVKKVERNTLFILPEALLNHFEIEFTQKLREALQKHMIYHIQLTEKNTLQMGLKVSNYGSKGFCQPNIIEDFPIRGKAVYFVVKRLRCRYEVAKKEINRNYSIKAEGSKLT